MKSGSRWPSVGCAIAARMCCGTVLGPEPMSNRCGSGRTCVGAGSELAAALVTRRGATSCSELLIELHCNPPGPACLWSVRRNISGICAWALRHFRFAAPGRSNGLQTRSYSLDPDLHRGIDQIGERHLVD